MEPPEKKSRIEMSETQKAVETLSDCDGDSLVCNSPEITVPQEEYSFTPPREYKKWQNCDRKLLVEIMAKMRCGIITQAVAGQKLGVNKTNISRWGKALDFGVGKMTLADEALRNEVQKMCEILAGQTHEHPARSTDLDPGKVAGTTRKYKFWTELDRGTLEKMLMRVKFREISKSDAARELGVSCSNISRWMARINSGGKLSTPGRPRQNYKSAVVSASSLDEILPSGSDSQAKSDTPKKYTKIDLPKSGKKFRVVKTQNEETGKIVSQLIPIIDVDIDDDDAKSVMSMKSNASLNASRKLVKRAMQFRPVCPIPQQEQESRISNIHVNREIVKEAMLFQPVCPIPAEESKVNIKTKKCDPEFVVATLLALGRRTLDLKKASKLLGKSEEIVNSWIKKLDQTFERPGREMMRTPAKAHDSWTNNRSTSPDVFGDDDVIIDNNSPPVNKSLSFINESCTNYGSSKRNPSPEIIRIKSPIAGVKKIVTPLNNFWTKYSNKNSPKTEKKIPQTPRSLNLPDLREGLPAPYLIYTQKLLKTMLALEEKDGKIRLFHAKKVQNASGKTYYHCATCGIQKLNNRQKLFGQCEMVNNKCILLKPHLPGCEAYTKEQILVMNLMRQTKARVKKFGVDPKLAFEHCWREIMVTAKEEKLKVEGEGGVRQLYDKINVDSMKRSLKKYSRDNQVAETEEALEKEGENIAELTSDVDPPFLMLSKHLQKNDLVINHSNSYSYIYSYHGRSKDYKKTFYKCPHCNANSTDLSKGVAHTMDGNLVYESRHIEGCAQFSKEQMLCLQMERNAKFRTFKLGNDPEDSYNEAYRELLTIARDEGLRVHGDDGVKDLFMSRSHFMRDLRHWRRKRRIIAEQRGIREEDVDMAIQNGCESDQDDEPENENETSNGESSQTDSHYFIYGEIRILNKELVLKCDDGLYRAHKNGGIVRTKTRADAHAYFCSYCTENSGDKKKYRHGEAKPGKVSLSIKSNKIVFRSAHIADCKGMSREEILALEHARAIKFNVVQTNMPTEQSWQEENTKMLAKAEAENLDIDGEFGVLAYFTKAPKLPLPVKKVFKKSFVPVYKSINSITPQKPCETLGLASELGQLAQVDDERIEEDPFIGPHLGFSAKLTKTLLIVPHEDKTVRIYNRVRIENSTAIQLELFNYQCPRCTMIKKDEEDLVATAIFSEGQVFKESLHHKSCDSYSREQITCTQIERQAKFNVLNHDIGCGNAWRHAKTVLRKLAVAHNYDIEILESQFVDLKTFVKQCIKLMEKQDLHAERQNESPIDSIIPEIGVETEIVETIE